MKLRKFVYVVMIAAVLLLAACASAPEAVEQPGGEQAATEPAAAEAPAAEAPAAAAPAEGEVATPVEYPEAALMEGMREPKVFPVSDIIEFKAFDEYCEPEWVTKLVEEGKLPPVAERLPKEPGVYKEGFYSDGVGEYGGIWRDVWAVPTAGWNYNAGVVQGWFGLEAIVQEEPLNTGAMFLSEGVTPIPFLAKSYEWSEDGLSLTMNLIEGAKWSDGVEFTTEDIMFLWEDNIMDPNVTTWTNASFWTIDGQPVTLEALDDYTLKFTFPVAFPTKFLYNLTNLNFSPGPAHILKPFHPKYGGTDYQSYTDALPPNKLPVVTMGPWVPVEYKTDEFMVMRRNPYYYKVDSNGCQLPYLDEVQFTYSKTGSTRTLNALAGTGDHSNVENIETMDETVRQAQDPNATFRVEWGPETLGFDIQFNQSKNLGVADDRDRAVRDLLRDVDFRKAIAYSIDREGLSGSLTNGPFFRPWAGALFPGSAYFDRENTVYYPYSPESAATLLEGIGLKDTNGDGTREFTEGPLAGQDVVIGLEVGEDQTAGISLGPAIVAFLQDVGIKVNFRTIAGTAGTDNDRSGTWEMRITRPGQAWAAPNVRCNEIAPGRTDFGWHRLAEGDIADDEYADFEQRAIEISQEFCLATDFETEYALMSELNKLYTDNVYNLGLIVGRYGLMLNKNFQNVPVGTPAFLYQWDANNYLMEQIWLQPEHRTDQGQSEIYPESVPYFEGCTYETDGQVCIVAPGQ
ncbi:MAG: ABC transporter substrate-binding protein [Caldilineaceae bacterium]|nr:ABC transporter substrate-binding protein [Caldilineaceae bacterium]